MPNAAYDVSVAVISSRIGQFTEALQFELQGTLCMFCDIVHMYVQCHWVLHLYQLVSFTYLCYLNYFLAEPKPPTDVTFRVTGTDSVMLSWTASLSKCGGITNYSVTYLLTSGTGPTTTVYTAETYTNDTSITLQGLIPNGVYRVMVSATNSMGDMSAISDATPPFTVSTPTAPTGGMEGPSYL